MLKNKSVLAIGDIHSPYNHADFLAFLKAIKELYKPDRVIQIGDEIDGHSFSFHEHNPDLLSPGDELKAAIERLKPLYTLFPKVDVLESNHGSLVYRKGVVGGIPRHVFKTYRQILEAPKGWRWHMDLTIKLSNGTYCYFTHGKTAHPSNLSKSMGMNVVQGHHHGLHAINYWSSPRGLFWQAFTGCLIEDTSLAFAYNKINILKPILGSLIILDGHPKLLPMLLNKQNRWIGKLL